MTDGIVVADPAIEVAAGLVFREGRLLITQRLPGQHLEGLWEFPGGKRESGESFEVCLARELFEELGIEASVHEMVHEVVHSYPEKTVHLCFFRCSWMRIEPRPIGCADLAWVSIDELSGYSFPAADTQLIDRLRQNAKWWNR